MAFFGLFDKKNCAICGAEIGLLGNRKLRTAIAARAAQRNCRPGLMSAGTAR